MPQSALIIGCGYVGMELAKLWKSRGTYLVGTTTDPSRVPELSAICNDAVIFDSKAPSSLKNLLKHVECVVLTIAAKNASGYESTYLDAAKALKEHSQVPQLIYTGSTSVYGDQDGRLVDEQTPLAPKNAQAHILAETEQVLLSITDSEHKVCILRCGEIFGPGREIAQRLQKRLEKPLAGDGCAITNIVHRDDVVRAIDFTNENRLSGVYNLCNSLHVTRKELYQRICQSHQWPEAAWDPTLKSLHGGSRIVDNRKICQKGFHFKHTDYI